MLKHVVPVEGKAAVRDDGTPITGKTAVDVTLPFYKNRLEEGGIKLWVRPKKEVKKDG